MISKIVANIHLLNLSVLVLAFDEHVLEEVVVMLLHFFVGNVGQMTSIRGFCGVLWVDVEILQENCLRESGSIVNPRASLSMSAGSGLEEERTVYFVFFCSEDTGEILSHGDF